MKTQYNIFYPMTGKNIPVTMDKTLTPDDGLISLAIQESKMACQLLDNKTRKRFADRIVRGTWSRGIINFIELPNDKFIFVRTFDK